MTPRQITLLGLLVCEGTDAENALSVRQERVNKAHNDLFNEMRAEQRQFAELQAAAHAVLTATDLTDVLAAHDRLAAALAACGTVTAPDSDTNNHEAIHGICAQGDSDDQ